MRLPTICLNQLAYLLVVRLFSLLFWKDPNFTHEKDFLTKPSKAVAPSGSNFTKVCSMNSIFSLVFPSLTFFIDLVIDSIISANSASAFRHKDELSFCFEEESFQRRELPLEILTENFKLVVFEKFDFESLDVLIDNSLGILSPSWTRTENQHTKQGLSARLNVGVSQKAKNP